MPDDRDLAELRTEVRRGFEETQRVLGELRRDLTEPLASARAADKARAEMHEAVRALVSSRLGVSIFAAVGLVLVLWLARAAGVLDTFVALVATVPAPTL